MALAHGLADVSFIKEQRVLSSLFFVRITPHSLHLPLAELNTRSGPVWSNCQIWSDCPLVLLLEMAHSTVTVLNISQVAGVSSISSEHFYILFFLVSSQTWPVAVTARAASTAATIFKMLNNFKYCLNHSFACSEKQCGAQLCKKYAGGIADNTGSEGRARLVTHCHCQRVRETVRLRRSPPALTWVTSSLRHSTASRSSSCWNVTAVATDSKLEKMLGSSQYWVILSDIG